LPSVDADRPRCRLPLGGSLVVGGRLAAGGRVHDADHAVGAVHADAAVIEERLGAVDENLEDVCLSHALGVRTSAIACEEDTEREEALFDDDVHW